MAYSNSIYRRLTGRRRTLLGFSQLWLAPDHILLVTSSRFVEQYQRFALPDIQAIVVTAMPDQTLLQTAAGATAISWTLLLLVVSSVFAKVFFAVTGTIALLAVLIDVLRGQRCRCHLHTTVSREFLVPVSRIATARKVLDTVRPAIEMVQGPLPPETVFETPSATATPDRSSELPHARGYLPEVLFSLFLVNALAIMLNARFPRLEAANVLPTTLFCEFFVLIVALVRRGSRDPRRIIYALMVLAIALVGWDAIGVTRHFGNWWLSLVMDIGRRGSPPVGIAPPVMFDQKDVLLAAAWRIALGLAGLLAARLEGSAEMRHQGNTPL